MSKIVILGSLFTILTSSQAVSQTQFWSDTFEDSGAPSSGSRTPSQNFSCGAPSTSYFFRTNTAGIAMQAGPYTAFQGSKFWAGEDIDQGPTCTNNSISSAQNVSWTGINISGKTGLSFRGLFAAQGNIGGTWESLAFGTNQDYIIVEYQIDGGSYTKALGFYATAASGATNTLALDANNDLVGEGVSLAYAFQEFTFNIPSTGTTLNLRVSFSSNNSGSEEMAVDNFRLFYASALPVTLSDFSSTCDTENEAVSWVAESEVRLDRYEVEASNEIQHFQTIARIASVGMPDQQQSYQYLIPKEKIANYYRLKMIDTDGSFTYSPVISGGYTCSTEEMLRNYTIQDRQLVLSLAIKYASIEIYSLTGQKLIATAFFNEEKKQTIPLNTDVNEMVLLKITDSRTGSSEMHLIRI